MVVGTAICSAWVIFGSLTLILLRGYSLGVQEFNHRRDMAHSQPAH